MNGGTVVTFGQSDGDDQQGSELPTTIDSLEGASIVDVAFGGKHTLILSVKGEVCFRFAPSRACACAHSTTRALPACFALAFSLALSHNRLH